VLRSQPNTIFLTHHQGQSDSNFTQSSWLTTRSAQIATNNNLSDSPQGALRLQLFTIFQTHHQGRSDRTCTVYTIFLTHHQGRSCTIFLTNNHGRSDPNWTHYTIFRIHCNYMHNLSDSPPGELRFQLTECFQLSGNGAEVVSNFTQSSKLNMILKENSKSLVAMTPPKNHWRFVATGSLYVHIWWLAKTVSTRHPTS
jgi:hypothetical protein